MNIKIAIKELAYFVCQSGDLTREYFLSKELEEGTKIHKIIQEQYNEKSQSEVYIKKEITYKNEMILLHGFIDGVLNYNDEIILEEIKATKIDFSELNTKNEHLAQLKIYGYLYSIEHNFSSIHLRLTYVSIIDYSKKEFDYILFLEDLEKFFFEILEKYMEWFFLTKEASITKQQTIQTVSFPFKTMRQGQKDLMKACYQTMKKNDILYVIAPTGIGKTMATIFSTLKSLEKNDKLFYCTAKGSGKNAPLNAIRILESQGLRMKTIHLIAKNKICNVKFKTCKPEECPFAIGYFDRIRFAIEFIFKNGDIYDEENILEVAKKFQICAFEFSLDLSYYCDVIIADYNYVFDPRVRLIRYFDSDTYHPKVLVDEAHNLVSRSKEMYSASINEEDIKIIRKILTGYKPLIRTDCNKIIDYIYSYKDNLKEKMIYVKNNLDVELITVLRSVVNKCDIIFYENKKISDKDEALEVYFKILNFINISEFFGENHRFIVKIENDICSIHLTCLDASNFLLETIENSIKGITFFSATLTPFEYYADLLTQRKGKFLELNSPFNPYNLDIIINNKVSTKYKQRIHSVDAILETIESITTTKVGNYIVFFPSYEYLNLVVEKIESPHFECLIQSTSLTEQQRDEMIEKFKIIGTCKVGFFVLGGVFSEGIDLIGEYLNGVVIVGVGLPMFCDENNLLKDFFEEKYQNGFEYAYTYPGFTKVIQAVGRVIRDENDKGIAVLIDERFQQLKYQQLMPKHWINKKTICDAFYLKKEIKNFFK